MEQKKKGFWRRLDEALEGVRKAVAGEQPVVEPVEMPEKIEAPPDRKKGFLNRLYDAGEGFRKAVAGKDIVYKIEKLPERTQAYTTSNYRPVVSECPKCGGTGRIKCDNCGGSGIILHGRMRLTPYRPTVMDVQKSYLEICEDRERSLYGPYESHICLRCDRSGQIVCPGCHGSGIRQ